MTYRIRIKGLTAAVVTPMKHDGTVNLDAIPDYAEFLIRRGVDGVFVNGTTGEGMLMDVEERKAVAQKWMDYSDRLNILVHVGSTSYLVSSKLASHAEEIGAKAISAMGPCFLPPQRVDELVAFNRIIAASAPNTPYYYYHIPGTSHVNVDMVEFLEKGSREIPTLSGINYTDFNTAVMLDCIRFADGRFDILHGHDETLIAGLGIGASGCIGTSYNITSPVFRKMISEYSCGHVQEARSLQWEANKTISLMNKRVNVIVGAKAMLEVMGINAGPCRLPVQNMTKAQKQELETEMKGLNILD